MKESITTDKLLTTKNNKVVLLDVKQIVRKGESLFFEVSFEGRLCYVRLFPFQENLLEKYIQKRNISCVYHGLDEHERPILHQDRKELIDELYEEDTVHTFKYVCSEGDSNREYHILRDDYGLNHHFYGKLTENQKKTDANIKVYVKSINETTNNLDLALYNPQRDSSNKIFSMRKIYLRTYVNLTIRNNILIATLGITATFILN